MHDFAVTDNGYAVIIQCPLYFNLLSILTGKDTEHCFMDWCPEDGVRFDVVDLQSRQIVASHTTTHAWWSFHYVNLQYDAGKHALLLDASVYDNPDIVNELYLDRVRAHPGQDHAESTLRRFEIPLGGGGKGVDGRGVSLVGDAAGCSYYDFPVIHPGCVGGVCSGGVCGGDVCGGVLGGVCKSSVSEMVRIVYMCYNTTNHTYPSPQASW